MSDDQVGSLNLPTEYGTCPPLVQPHHLRATDVDISFCQEHPNVIAIGKCKKCGKLLCVDCQNSVPGKNENDTEIYCSKCVETVKHSQMALGFLFFVLFLILVFVLGGITISVLNKKKS